MEKLLRLYTYVDGGINDTPFPNADNPIEIGAFRYDAKRMGGAPTITASVNYASCLDDKWTDNVYATFNGEKHYLKQIPTSSYNNSSAMYKHDIELVSERVALDNVYFFDVVSEDVVDDDKPVSNSTKVVFFGDVREFANRLKASLQYSALDYDVVVDTGVASEEKLISFEDQFFSNVLQEIYNTYEVPYYFEGKTIHIGYSKPNEELPSFAYGVDDALLSISKNNANYKVVNRATGTGSSENIPFYYPNNSPKGNIRAELNTASDDFSIEAVDLPTFSNKIDLDGVIEAKMVSLSVSSFMLNDEEYTLNYMPQAHITVNSYQIYRDNVAFVAYSSSAVKGKFAFTIRISHDASEYMAKIHVGDKTLDPISVVDDKINFEIEVDFEKAGNKEILAEVALSYIPQGHSSIRRAYNVAAGSGLGWFYKDKAIELKDVGIKYQGTPSEGDKITQKLIEYINTSQSLMPSKYRDTKGAERFYNATNDTYEGVTFNNPFVAGKPPKEHIVKIEDIKPSIEGMLVNGQRIDMFSEFAYDEDDNDETYEDEEGNVCFKHPYFYGKLRVMDFNLFDHAIENQPMTISFTSGDVGACNFEIGVTEEYPQKNPVQVYEEDITIDGILHKAGSLKRDENGMVLAGVEGTQQLVTEFQDRQQDTSKYEVWVALKKEEETYGILMPQVAHRPKACAEGQNDGDTFVILGINLPDEYILNAERRLEAEIIKYLQDNNDEKFTFSIGFSRIYFAENEDVLNSLNENSKIQITYDNKTYDLYVSSFSYTMSESDALPEIKVELDETLKTSQNAIQKAINEVKTTLGSAINEVSQGVAMQRRSYVSKVQDDTAMGVVDFSKGVKFGEGGKVEILDNNSAKLTIEYLEVTKKATFTSLEIQEKTHVGGQMLVTPASMNCGEVEEFEGFYRCYFQTKGADGSEEIFNQFVVGDQAICQTFNAWGSKYYWRLVVGVGEDYVDLSKEDCDEGSGAPEAGDRIIQMGNREDEARQNAIVIAAHGDNSPYIVQYKGINNFDLPNSEDDERIITLLSPTRNILTGQVRMTAGSKGLEMFEEWAEVEAALGNIEGLETIKEVIENNFTAITGGLIQSGLLMLGYYDEEGKYHVMSGTNGVYDANATGGGIAAWYGGAMSEDSAKTVLRFDGSGFFANKNITWDNEGGASFAGGKITITKEGALTFSDTIAFGSGGDSVSTVLEKLSTLLSYFTLEGNELSTNYQVRIKNNLIVEQDTSSGGTGQDTPSAGLDEEQLQDYLDLHKYVTESRVQEMIDEVAAGDVDLTNYYTKQEVDAKIPSLEGYAKTTEVDNKINELNLSQYAKASDLDALQAEVDNIDAVLGLSETAEGYINTWAEVKAFLDGYKNADDLATILSGINADIAKNAENIATLDKDKADNATVTALAERVSTNEGAIDALDKRVTSEEAMTTTYASWWADLKKYIKVEGDNVKIDTNLIVEGDTSSGGSGQDTPASGTVTGIKVGPMSTDILTPNNAGIIDMVSVLSSIDVSDQLKDYAKLTDITKSRIDSVLGSTTAGNANRFLMSTGSTSVWAAISKTNVTDALGYTPLSTGGGTISGDTDALKIVRNTNGYSAITYYNTQNGVTTLLGVMGFDSNGEPSAYRASDNAWRTMLHSGNYSSYALPLNGGTIGAGNANQFPLTISSTSSYTGISFATSGGTAYMRYQGGSTWGVTDAGWNSSYTLIHSGNYSSYALPKSGGTIEGTNMRPLTINTTASDFEIQLQSKGNTKVDIGWNTTDGAFFQEYESLEYLGIKTDGTPYYYNGLHNTLIHSGNIGSYAFVPKSEIINNTDADYLLTNGVYLNATGNGSGNSNFPSAYSAFLTFSQSSKYAAQISIGSNAIHMRRKIDSWSHWMRIIAENENGNVLIGKTDDDGSGAKLQVNGFALFKNGDIIHAYDESGTRQYVMGLTSSLSFGYGTAGAGIDTYILGKNLYFRYGTSRTNGLILNASGNVTFGASDLAESNYKLAVNGGSAVFVGTNDATNLSSLTKSNVFSVCNSADANFGLNMWVRWDGTAAIQSSYIGQYTNNYYGIALNPFGGNILIGTTSDSGNKLYVSGDTRFDGQTRISGSMRFYGKTNLSSDMYIDNQSVGGLNFAWSDGVSRFFIGNNVGIGTTDPKYKLDVNGSGRFGHILINKGYGSNVGGDTIEMDSAGATLWMQYYHNGGINMCYGGGQVTMGGALSVAGAVTITGVASVGVAQSAYNANRAQLSVISSTTEPAMLWLGSNSEKKWSIESRGSGDNYRFSLYSWVAAKHLLYITHEGDATINGNLVVSGDTSSGSDIRFKDIIKNKTIKIADIAKAPLFTFKWNDREDDSIHLGSSAQYWEKVTPWLVKGEDFKTLDYSTLGVAMGISLAKKAVNHEERIKVLEKEIKRLKEEMRYGS